MARRRELYGIGIDWLNAFVSRNNDVDGYWGIAMLRESMHKHKIETLQIDVSKPSIEVDDQLFENMLLSYWELWRTLIVNRGLRLGYVKASQLTITSKQLENLLIDSKEPLEMICQLDITSDLKTHYQIKQSILCRRHNRNTDIRSGRIK